MDMKFYKCNHCGNIIMPAVDSGVNPFCCGDQMELLKAGSTDAAVEKHVPVIERGEDGKHRLALRGSFIIYGNRCCI